MAETIGATPRTFDASPPLDNAAFQPTNIPLKKVARAWERRPYSPLAPKPAVKKVWRRERMPAFTAPPQPRQRADPSREVLPSFQEPHDSIASPKKAVKKQCLKTAYGRDWRTTEWEARSAHTRKRASRPPIVLRSGTVIDTNSDDEENVPSKSDHPDDTASIATEEPTDSEWEDVESTTEEQGACELEDVGPGVDSEGDGIENTNRHPAVDQGTDTSASTDLMRPDHHYDEEMEKLVLPNVALQDLPQTDLAELWQKMAGLEDNPELKDVFSALETLGSSMPEIFQPESVMPAPQSARERARISDDTAVLHAFLDRAAANKSMARRESITNRRDSDRVRDALADPPKAEVLAELDANTSSPQKAARQAVETGEGKPPVEQLGSVVEGTVDEKDQKPKRRSGRTKARQAFLRDSSVEDVSGNAPSRITIRASQDQPLLKKTEKQELAHATRTNTRRNKGQSVMPPIRLGTLAKEPAEEIEVAERTAEARKGGGKAVHWDETLAYFSKTPEKLPGKGSMRSRGPPADGSGGSPTKTRTRRERSSKKVMDDETTAPSTPAPAAKATAAGTKRRSRIATPAKGLLSKASFPPCGPETEPEPSTAQSAAADESSVSTTTTTATTAATETTKRARSIPTPRRSAVSVVAALKRAQPGQQPSGPTPPTTTATAVDKVCRLPSKPAVPPTSPRKQPAPSSSSAIPSLVAFAAPKMSSAGGEDAVIGQQQQQQQGAAVGGRRRVGPPSRGGGSEELGSTAGAGAVGGSAGGGGGGSGSGSVPGLASPAKRRQGLLGPATRGGGLVMREVSSAEGPVVLPGLASPAKKRTRNASSCM